jgi:hypothetical protein
MPDPDYIALTGAAYVPPECPDIPNYAGVLDRGELQEMKELYLEETRVYNEARAFTNAIKKLMVAVIPNLHLGRLNDRLHGLANVTPQAILQHLMTTYGDIDEDARTRNLAQLSTPWDPSTLLNTVFLNADLCQSFAAEGGNPFLMQPTSAPPSMCSKTVGYSMKQSPTGAQSHPTNTRWAT